MSKQQQQERFDHSLVHRSKSNGLSSQSQDANFNITSKSPIISLSKLKNYMPQKTITEQLGDELYCKPRSGVNVVCSIAPKTQVSSKEHQIDDFKQSINSQRIPTISRSQVCPTNLVNHIIHNTCVPSSQQASRSGDRPLACSSLDHHHRQAHQLRLTHMRQCEKQTQSQADSQVALSVNQNQIATGPCGGLDSSSSSASAPSSTLHQKHHKINNNTSEYRSSNQFEHYLPQLPTKPMVNQLNAGGYGKSQEHINKQIQIQSRANSDSVKSITDKKLQSEDNLYNNNNKIQDSSTGGNIIQKNPSQIAKIQPCKRVELKRIHSLYQNPLELEDSNKHASSVTDSCNSAINNNNNRTTKLSVTIGNEDRVNNNKRVVVFETTSATNRQVLPANIRSSISPTTSKQQITIASQKHCITTTAITTSGQNKKRAKLSEKCGQAEQNRTTSRDEDHKYNLQKSKGEIEGGGECRVEVEVEEGGGKKDSVEALVQETASCEASRIIRNNMTPTSLLRLQNYNHGERQHEQSLEVVSSLSKNDTVAIFSNTNLESENDLNVETGSSSSSIRTTTLTTTIENRRGGFRNECNNFDTPQEDNQKFPTNQHPDLSPPIDKSISTHHTLSSCKNQQQIKALDQTTSVFGADSSNTSLLNYSYSSNNNSNNNINHNHKHITSSIENIILNPITNINYANNQTNYGNHFNTINNNSAQAFNSSIVVENNNQLSSLSSAMGSSRNQLDHSIDHYRSNNNTTTTTANTNNDTDTPLNHQNQQQNNHYAAYNNNLQQSLTGHGMQSSQINEMNSSNQDNYDIHQSNDVIENSSSLNHHHQLLSLHHQNHHPQQQQLHHHHHSSQQLQSQQFPTQSNDHHIQQQQQHQNQQHHHHIQQQHQTQHQQHQHHHQQHHHQNQQHSLYQQLANNHIYGGSSATSSAAAHSYSNPHITSNGSQILANQASMTSSNCGSHHLNSAAAACAAAAVVSQTLKTVANQHNQHQNPYSGHHHHHSSIANGFGNTSSSSIMNIAAGSHHHNPHQTFQTMSHQLNHHLTNQAAVAVAAVQQHHHHAHHQSHHHHHHPNLPMQAKHHIPSIATRKYQCKMCPQVFMSKAEMKYHNQNHMREAKPYKCSQCPKAFANSSYLSQHMRIHQGVKPYSCELCSRKFTQLSHLQQHKRTHTGDKPYKCNYHNCTKQFSQLSNLQSHSRCHQLDKPYKCNSCYKCFHDEASLLEHIPRHLESKHLKKNLCVFCGSSYQHERGLVKHFQQYHTDKSPTLVAAAIAAGTTGNMRLIASMVTAKSSYGNPYSTTHQSSGSATGNSSASGSSVSVSSSISSSSSGSTGKIMNNSTTSQHNATNNLINSNHHSSISSSSSNNNINNNYNNLISSSHQG